MRTVDPYLWSKKFHKPPLNLERGTRLGVRRSPLERQLRGSLRDALKEFWRNCSAGGVKLVNDRGTYPLLRLCYLLFILVTMVIGFSLTAVNLMSFSLNPPLIVNDLMEETVNLTFPAVAICSYNVVSKAALNRYARYLMKFETNWTYTVSALKANLLALGTLVTSTALPADTSFTKFLADIKETNVTHIMYKLSPPCSSMVLRCSWRGRRVPCDKLFAPRITSVGFCCVFNSRYMPYDYKNRVFKPKTGDEYSGLSVVVREDDSDFGIVRKPGQGFEVGLFDGIQFPLSVAGVVRWYMVQRHTEVFMKLKSRRQYAATELLRYSDSSRGCRWTGEDGRRVDTTSWSRCLTRCHRDAAIALCGCAPFTLPSYDGSVATDCSTEHLQCLAKHKEKFLYFYAGEAAHPSLSEEAENSQECLADASCQHNCARRWYTADVEFLWYRDNGRDHYGLENRFLTGIGPINTTALHLYYTKKHQPVTVLESNRHWYEYTASVSCQLVCVVVLTIFSFVEFIYHCTIRWLHHFLRRRRMCRMINNY